MLLVLIFSFLLYCFNFQLIKINKKLKIILSTDYQQFTLHPSWIAD